MNITNFEDLKYLVRNRFDGWRTYGEVNTKIKGDLILFNYSPAAVYAGNWNWFERVSRGLIMNWKTGEIVGRPFDKFFNLGEQHGQPAPDAELLAVYNKLDGSLGIGYLDEHGDGQIATRGSFDSVQAQWAYQWFDEDLCNMGQLEVLMHDGWTPLFEIIYPGNRIIVDYGKRAECVLLACRHRETGEYMDYEELWSCAGTLGVSVVKEWKMMLSQVKMASKLLDPLKAEGYVLHFSDGTMAKVKGEQYLRIAKILSGATPMKIARATAEGTYESFRDTVPDEFAQDITRWHDITMAHFNRLTALGQVMKGEFPECDGREFAEWVREHYEIEMRPFVFLLKQDKDPADYIWKLVFAEIKEMDDDHVFDQG